jgi:hypothetical protein
MTVLFKQFIHGGNFHIFLKLYEKKYAHEPKKEDIDRNLDFLLQSILTSAISPGYQFSKMCNNNEVPRVLCTRFERYFRENESKNKAILLVDLQAANFMYSKDDGKVYLVDFEVNTEWDKIRNLRERYMFHTSSLGWLDYGTSKNINLAQRLHFGESLDCPKDFGYNRFFQFSAKGLFWEGSNACYEFGKNVLVKRQSLGFSEVSIKKKPVRYEGTTKGMFGFAQPRYLDLNVKDIDEAILSYYPKDNMKSQKHLSLKFGQCTVHSPSLSGFGKSHIRVISKEFIFEFDVTDTIDLRTVLRDLRTVCGQSAYQSSGTLIFDGRKHYYEEYPLVDHTNKKLILYGRLRGIFSSEFQGFTNYVVVNSEDRKCGKNYGLRSVEFSTRKLNPKLSKRMKRMESGKNLVLECRDIDLPLSFMRGIEEKELPRDTEENEVRRPSSRMNRGKSDSSLQAYKVDERRGGASSNVYSRSGRFP